MDKDHVLIIGIVLFLGFHLLKAIAQKGPVLITEENYEILKRIRYLEHEGYSSSLTGDKWDKENMEELLEKLPTEYHKYIDTQNYIDGTKVVHIQFEVY